MHAAAQKQIWSARARAAQALVPTDPLVPRSLLPLRSFRQSCPAGLNESSIPQSATTFPSPERVKPQMQEVRESRDSRKPHFFFKGVACKNFFLCLSITLLLSQVSQCAEHWEAKHKCAHPSVGSGHLAGQGNSLNYLLGKKVNYLLGKKVGSGPTCNLTNLALPRADKQARDVGTMLSSSISCARARGARAGVVPTDCLVPGGLQPLATKG